MDGILTFCPNDAGIKYYPGDTIYVKLTVCDSPDICSPNCATYFWRFFLIPGSGCSRVPNPFTPNSDRQNDRCQFTFPGLVYEVGHIYIYDILGNLVRRIDVPKGEYAKDYAVWNGCDSNGKPLPQGVYVYVIEVGGEVVCEGTVTIAR